MKMGAQDSKSITCFSSVFECIRSRAIVAEIVFFLYKTAESLLQPSVKLFIYQEVCLVEYEGSEDICSRLRHHRIEEAHIQKISANYIMYYKILLNLPAIVLGLFCGAWSDRVGRKLPMMMPCVGTILACLSYMLGMLPQWSALGFVLIGAAIAGCFGKGAVISMAVHSYVADVSSKEERTKKLGKLLSMNFFGIFLGSLLAGLLLDIIAFNIIFSIVVIIMSISIVVILVFLKETISTSEDEVMTLHQDGDEPLKKQGSRFLFNPVNVKESVRVLVEPRQGFLRCHLLIIIFCVILNQVCKAGEIDVTLLFVELYPLSWSKSLYGYLLAVDYASLALSLCFILPLMSVVFKVHDSHIVLVGLSFKIVRLIFLSVSNRTWMIFLGVIIGSVSGLIVSGSKSMISKIVNEDEIGKIFSLLSCGETASNLIGAVIFTNLYSATFNIFPGLTFIFEAVIYLVCLSLFVWISKDVAISESSRLLEKLSGSSKNDYGSEGAKNQTPNPYKEMDGLSDSDGHEDLAIFPLISE